jgi:hypothetical protein
MHYKHKEFSVAKKKNSKNTSILPTRLKQINRHSLLVFLIIFALVGAITYRQIYAAPKIRGVSLTLSPSNQTLMVGSELTIQVWADARERSMNAVQANLTYDINYFDFVSVNGTGSAFVIDASSTNSDGLIQIARGNIQPLTGRQLVANVVLRAKARIRKTTVQFRSDSIITDSVNSTNILVGRGAGSYRINE